ncbi:hypothetical protein CRUP_035533, partial [Coryphaenoides rupestris]
ADVALPHPRQLGRRLREEDGGRLRPQQRSSPLRPHLRAGGDDPGSRPLHKKKKRLAKNRSRDNSKDSQSGLQRSAGCEFFRLKRRQDEGPSEGGEGEGDGGEDDAASGNDDPEAEPEAVGGATDDDEDNDPPSAGQPEPESSSSKLSMCGSVCSSPGSC